MVALPPATTGADWPTDQSAAKPSVGVAAVSAATFSALDGESWPPQPAAKTNRTTTRRCMQPRMIKASLCQELLMRDIDLHRRLRRYRRRLGSDGARGHGAAEDVVGFGLGVGEGDV